MMELKRLKDLREQRSREERRVVATYKGADKVIEQIKDRDLKRLKQEEIRQLERVSWLKHLGDAGSRYSKTKGKARTR